MDIDSFMLGVLAASMLVLAVATVVDKLLDKQLLELEKIRKEMGFIDG